MASIYYSRQIPNTTVTLKGKPAQTIPFIDPINIPDEFTQYGATAFIDLNLGYAQSQGPCNFTINIPDGLGATALITRFNVFPAPLMGAAVHISGVYEIAPKASPTFTPSWVLNPLNRGMLSIINPTVFSFSVQVFPDIV